MDYLNINQLLTFIEEPNRSSCLLMLKDNMERFRLAPGSLTKHQAWSGGYIHHLEETMNFGYRLFGITNEPRKLDFTISDVMLILFLHDLEKPFRYVEPKMQFQSDEEKELFIEEMVKKYGIILSESHRNALRYVHGEGDDYSRTERIQKPLAAFVHICDVVSARIWFNYPVNMSEGN